jgi:hypothetical protein
MNRRFAPSFTCGLPALLLASAACSAPSEADSTALSADLSAPAPLVGAGSGLCLDVAHNSTAAGTPLQIYTCNS